MDRLTLALYQPDIAQNTGTILRTCACFGIIRGDYRAGRLSGLRSAFPPRRNGLSRPCRDRAPHFLDGFRGLAGRDDGRRLVLLSTRARMCPIRISPIAVGRHPARRAGNRRGCRRPSMPTADAACRHSAPADICARSMLRWQRRSSWPRRLRQIGTPEGRSR